MSGGPGGRFGGLLGKESNRKWTALPKANGKWTALPKFLSKHHFTDRPKFVTRKISFGVSVGEIWAPKRIPNIFFDIW